MNVRRIIVLVMAAAFGVTSPGWGAFTTRGSVTIGASATVSGAGATTFSIQAGTLPATAFFGKNAVMPIQVISNSGPINSKNLSVNVVYQLLDSNGSLLGAPIGVPVTFAAEPGNPNALTGNAIIPASDLQSIQHSGAQLTYLFVAQQGAAGTLRNNSGQSPAPALSALTSAANLGVFKPFATTITDHICSPVSPTGALVIAPDLSLGDGKTAVSLAPGVVPAPDTLCIKIEDTSLWPSGPGGSKAAAIYTVTLANTSLAGSAELILSYAANLAGKVLNSGADAGSLGIYWLDQTNGALPSGEWRPLSRATLDSTLHTLTGMTGHFSTFALFAAGAVGSADLRPSERIITPNGDGINDKAIFGSGIDEVKIFDVRGRRVKTIAGPAPQWDGTDDNGKIVESGVYLYQYTSQGDRISGVIAVAK